MNPFTLRRRAKRAASAAAILIPLVWLASGWFYINADLGRGYRACLAAGAVSWGWLPGGRPGAVAGRYHRAYVWAPNFDGPNTPPAPVGSNPLYSTTLASIIRRPGLPVSWTRTLPLWIPFILAAVLAALLAHLDRRARRTTAICTACTYDRRGLPPATPCPECGAPPSTLPTTPEAPTP